MLRTICNKSPVSIRDIIRSEQITENHIVAYNYFQQKMESIRLPKMTSIEHMLACIEDRSLPLAFIPIHTWSGFNLTTNEQYFTHYNILYKRRNVKIHDGKVIEEYCYNRLPENQYWAVRNAPNANPNEGYIWISSGEAKFNIHNRTFMSGYHHCTHINSLPKKYTDVIIKLVHGRQISQIAGFFEKDYGDTIIYYSDRHMLRYSEFYIFNSNRGF